MTVKSCEAGDDRLPLLEQLLSLLEKGLADGTFTPIAEVGKFLKFRFLSRGEVCGHLDIDPNM
jgi:hypothetical protein